MSNPYPDYNPNDAAPGYAGASSGSYQPYGAAPQPYTDSYQSPETNGMAIAALVVSIIAVLLMLSVIGTVLAPVVGLIGIVLAIIAIVKARSIVGPGRRMAMSITSLVLSTLVTVVVVCIGVLFVTVFVNTGVMDCMGIQNPDELNQCIEDAMASLDTTAAA
ncbi:DUF4870 domain-containing protein [Corynebacterium uterequi]|uniref:Uncharacterized protein n=1 Tax=Corynebacterium uterequi TaxID=1072256 RepID=A0A0G3HJI0_9CORY|nr:DUF4870 domain-containing protein [Corynebacterium uterequi]AKK11267.1 hypothetical protein CUTER_06390 [Corynebacterium uterequi]